MPEGSGFDLLASWSGELPKIVFVTAYDAFALRAFEVNALDYLLKPILPRRLAQAWQRLTAAPGAEPVLRSAENVKSVDLRVDDHVLVREEDRCWFVPVERIRLLEAHGNHTCIHFDDARPLLYRTLLAVEQRLPAELFLRANRSQLVNRRFIRHVEPWFSGGLKVTLADGTEVEFSRRQSQLLRERLEL